MSSSSVSLDINTVYKRLSIADELTPLNNNKLIEQDEDGPDGGFGWVIVAACFTMLIIAEGVNNSFGVYLDHYTRTWQDRSDIKSLSFVGSLAVALLSLLAGPGGSLAERVGFPIATGLGGFIFALGLFLASFSNQVWQLYLTQGVMLGIGSAIMFSTASSAPSQWFTKRRGLATGICLTGPGVGGLIFSPITQYLINEFGIEWTLRIISGVVLLLTCIASPFVRTRVPLNTDNEIVNFSIFKNTKFRAILLSEFISGFGVLVPLFLIPNYVISQGLTEYDGALLISIINGGTALGAIVLGCIADYVGPLNMLTISMLSRGIICFCLWPYAVTFGPLAAFCMLFGSTIGALLSITPIAIASMFGLEELASINGLIYLGAAIPELIGAPIGAYIIELFSTPTYTNYLPLIYYTGGTTILASLVLLYIKLMVDRRFLKIV